MSANFIPPIPIGQFKPSSEAIASWLYEIWKYLQENPIPTSSDVTQEAAETAQNYIAVNVPPMIAAAIAGLEYSDLVTNTTLPIYRASNDEIGQADLLEAWNEGCRFALVDDEEFFIMIKNNETITLLQVLTEEQATNVVSVNGKTGVVIITSSDISNASDVSGATITAALNNLNSRGTNDIANQSNVNGASVTAALNTLLSLPRLTDIVTQSLISGATVSTSGTDLINTTLNRKFSDYFLIIFLVGASANDFRAFAIVPGLTWWALGKTIYLNSAHGATLENNSGMTINYASDTAINATLTGNKAYTFIEAVGILKQSNA